MGNQHILLSAIKRQFEKVLNMWEEEINNIPDEGIKTSEIDHMIPARHIIHIVPTIDFYLGNIPAGEYDFKKLCKGDWEQVTLDELPDKKKCLDYLNQGRAIIESRFKNFQDEDLKKKEEVMPWTGETFLDRILYLLRHTQHHLGEMHRELRGRGINRAQWQ